MKYVSAIMLTLGVGAGLMSAVVSPANQEPQIAQTTKAPQHEVVAPKTQEVGTAIRVIAPTKDLESAIRMSEKGDVLVQGPEGWYRIEGKTLQQGTKVYVLSQPGSMVSAFPKEADTVR